MIEITGFIAAGFVVAAFWMRDILKLRLCAICSNILFLAYGLGLGLAPILLLHAVLLPLNIQRLHELRRSAGAAPDWPSERRLRGDLFAEERRRLYSASTLGARHRGPASVTL